jgi:WD40 repeat protein
MDTAELKKRFEPLEVVSFEYKRQLWQARFSPCGDYLIAGGYDATIQRWKIDNAALESAEPTDPKKRRNAKEAAEKAAKAFKPLPEFAGHNGWVQSIQLIAKGQKVVSADSWGQVSCWKYSDAEPKPIWTIKQALSGWIRCLAVSPDESQVAVGGNDRVVRIFSTQDGSVVREFPVTDNVYSLAFHPKEPALLAGDLRGVVTQWNVTNKETKPARTLDASSLYQLNHMQDCGGVRTITFDSDGQRVLCGGQTKPGGGFAKGAPAVLLFDWKTGKSTELVAGASDDGFIYDAQYHSSGFFIGCASAFPGKGKLFFWQPGDAKPFFTGTKLTNGRSVSLHPDGKRLAYLSSNSANANGRPLKDGAYIGGTALIRILKFPEPSDAKA